MTHVKIIAKDGKSHKSNSIFKKNLPTEGREIDMKRGLVFYDDGLVFRHKHLDDDPTDEISHSTDTEHHHIGGRFTLEAEE